MPSGQKPYTAHRMHITSSHIPISADAVGHRQRPKNSIQQNVDKECCMLLSLRMAYKMRFEALHDRAPPTEECHDEGCRQSSAASVQLSPGFVQALLDRWPLDGCKNFSSHSQCLDLPYRHAGVDT